jgi:hypothetical protein
MDNRLSLAFQALRVALGLMATLAGLDKFLNILTDWGAYVSPSAAAMLPVSVGTFMTGVGVIETAVGLTILFGARAIGAYVASGWLLLVALNLALGGHFDVAVRDVVLSVAAFALADDLAARRSTARARIGGPAVKGALIASLLMLALPTAAIAQTTTAATTLQQNMRHLWTDHVVWTRAYVVAAVGDGPDAQAAATRLMKNQEDIGAAIATYYGKGAGDQLTTLLKEHINIAVDIIKHAKAGNTAAQQQASDRWTTNAEDIAAFLSKANPNWPRATLVDMMNMHLKTTTDEVVARLTKNWSADVRAYDMVYDHILKMADALSAGIITQFPARFAR